MTPSLVAAQEAAMTKGTTVLKEMEPPLLWAALEMMAPEAVVTFVIRVPTKVVGAMVLLAAKLALVRPLVGLMSVVTALALRVAQRTARAAMPPPPAGKKAAVIWTVAILVAVGSLAASVVVPARRVSDSLAVGMVVIQSNNPLRISLQVQ